MHMRMSEQPSQQPSTQPQKDHRVLGRELDLFSFQDIAPGAPFWHPKGMMLFKELERRLRALLDRDYEETSTPIMVKKDVFERSGHWEYYRENMFYFDVDGETYVLKPMNCPESTYIYKSHVRSWRELPVRLSEIGRLHRNELSGVVGGLFRVRQITMDDAHIYCTKAQITDEVVAILRLLNRFYNEIFQFPVTYYLATRPKKALGERGEWDEAESSLKQALETHGVAYKLDEGEGAFYGPKIEVHVEDSLGRDWQMGTVQLDLFLSRNFDATYTDEAGKRVHPVVIHRAIFGSFERFIGMLLEHTQGALPFWLSPVQVAALSVTDAAAEYAKNVSDKLAAAGIRVKQDARNETINKKIREAEKQKIPYILIVGEKEAAAETVSVRERGTDDKGSATAKEFIKKLTALLA
jgi:threonyl-tRNA synthetase